MNETDRAHDTGRLTEAASRNPTGPTRALHVITGLSTGGAETMLYRLLASQPTSCTAAVVSLCDRGTLGDPIEALGIPVHTLDMRRGVPGARALLKLRHLIAREKADLVQGWMYHANLAATMATATMPNAPPLLWNIRYTLDNLSTDKPLTRWLIRWGGLVSGGPSRIIYNSHHSACQHERLGYGPDKTVVIPNGIDCARFRPDPDARRRMRAALGIPDDAWLIGHFARYHPMKDHLGLLQAASIARQDGRNNLFFVLAGHAVTPDNPALSSRLDALNLNHCCRLLGERQDVAELMNALDIATSASFTGEAFPNVVAEAMACGIPCVATDVGDSALIIGHSGRIVPPSQPAVLARAWLELIDAGRTELSALGAAARRRVQQRFSLERACANYQGLYRTVVDETPNRR